MATMIDISMFQSFGSLFAFLLVFVLVFAILEVKKFFGNSGLHALISLFIATMVATSSNVMPLIAWMTPWFVIVLFFFVFVMLLTTFIGVSEEGFIAGLGGETGVTIAMLVVIGIIFAAALGQIYGQQALELTTGQQNITAATGVPSAASTFRENVAAVFFHPKVLGMLLILLIAAFTIRLMANPT